MSEGEKELPQGWADTTIGNVISEPRTKVKPDTSSKLPFIGMDHIESESFVLVGQDEFKNMKSAGSPFSPGDVLYGRLRPYLNKVHTAKFEGVASAEFIVLPKAETHRSEFFKFLLHHIRFVHYANAKSSGDRPRVKFDRLAEYDFWLPPLAEQSRIVDKIDELFSSIEAGERAIARARTALTRYRKAVLKAAVTGELTADWRAKNPPSETAQDLLARILKARYSAWEKAELEKLDAKGKARPKTEKEWTKFRTKYKVPVEPNSANSSNLPKGWLGVTVDQISEFITSGSRGWAKYYSAEGPLFVRVGNFNRSSIELDFKKLQCVSPPVGVEGARTKLQLNDLLISITADVGMVGIFRGQYEDAYINQHVALVRMPDDVNEEWVAWAIVNPTKQQEILGTGRGATKDGLTLSDLRELRIPFPPAEEQDEIVSRVEQALSKADKAEATLRAQAKQAKALKQAVLKTAFEGRLVPQDPNDEPASELLKRIKAAS